MKNLLKILMPVIGLGLANADASYGQNQKDSTENTKDDKLYEDFKKFVKKKDNWHLTSRPVIGGEHINYYKNHIFDAMATSKQVSLYFDNGEKIIEVIDNGANGLNLKEGDIYFEYKIDGKNIVNLKELKDSNSAECLNQFKKVLKQIMRDEEFGRY